MKKLAFVLVALFALVSLLASPVAAQYVGNTVKLIPKSTYTGASWDSYTGDSYQAAAVHYTKIFDLYDCDSAFVGVHVADTAKISRITLFNTVDRSTYVYTDSIAFNAADTLQTTVAAFKNFSKMLTKVKGPYGFFKVVFAATGNVTGANIGKKYKLILQKYRNW